MSLTVDSGQTLQRCLALDIGGTKIASAIVKNGEIQQRKQISTPQDDAAQVMHQTLAQLLKEYEGQFDYVAVASTGIINQGILTALNPKNLGGLAQFPLKDSIAQHTDKPIGLLNDVQAAAYAEYQLQNPNDVQNFTFITVSTGVGGGLILNHRLLTEPNGIAGHIGHTLADPNGPVCGCGRRGCVEAIASGRAIEAASSQWDDPCDPKEVFVRFRQNDEKATALVTRSAQAIANLIADLKIGLDMQKVVVGGSVGLAEGYLPLVQSLLSELPAVYHCELESAKFGQDAGLIGAAYWVKDCIAQHTDKPIGLLNDVQAAAYAEYQLQNPNDVQNFTFITVSTGVGGGLILNHRLLTEPNGIAGHIGHTLADPNGPVCGCGRRGCVEAIASGRAIEAVSSQWDDPCDPKEVFVRFRQNDEKATALVTRSAQAIANLIADLKIGLDMQKVVVGGSVGLAEGYLPLVQSLLSELPAVYHCELESAQFGQDAGLIGAAYWVKDCLLQAKNTGVVYG